MNPSDRSYIRQWRDTLRAMRGVGHTPVLPTGDSWVSRHDRFLRGLR